MKTLANRIMMFAASALVLGTVAYGQTQLTVTIPFAFRTANTTLPSGTYVFNRQAIGGVTVTILFPLAPATERYGLTKPRRPLRTWLRLRPMFTTAAHRAATAF